MAAAKQVMALLELVFCILGLTVPAKGDGFIGYSIDGASANPINCASGLTFTIHDTIAGCCAGACDLATSCSGSTMFHYGSLLYCTGGQTCVTPTIYNDYPTGTPTWTVFGCVNDWTARTLYRSSPILIPTTSFTSSIPSSTTAPVTTSTSSSTPSPTPGNASPSQAWIAGAVIGSVAILAIFGFSAFWFGWRRVKKNKDLQSSQPAEQMGGQFLPPDSQRTSQYTWKPEQVSPVPQEATIYETSATGTWSRPAEM